MNHIHSFIVKKNHKNHKKTLLKPISPLKNGHISVDSDPRSGRPSLTTTPENIERVRLAIEGDRRLTVRELKNDFGIPKTTVWAILNKILGMTRVCTVTGFFTMITRLVYTSYILFG